MAESRSVIAAFAVAAILASCPMRASAYACADDWVPYIDANFHGPTPGITRVGTAVRFTAETGDCKWRHAIPASALRVEIGVAADGPFTAVIIGGHGAIAEWTPPAAGRFFVRVHQGARATAGAPEPRPAQLVVDVSEPRARVAVRLLLGATAAPPSSHRLLLVALDVPDGWEAPRIAVPWPRHARERSVQLPVGSYDVFEGFRLEHLSDGAPIVKTFLLFHARGATPLRIVVERAGDVTIGD